MMLNGIIIQETDMMLLVIFLLVLNIFNARLHLVYVIRGNMSNIDKNTGNMTSLKSDEPRE